MGNSELHSQYEQGLSCIPAPSFDSIRNTAISMLSRFSDAEKQQMYEDLDRGKAIIDREELLWRYLLAFGKKHRRHLDIAFGKLPRPSSVVGDGYSVVDWGCGQGLATVCLLDYLKNKRIDALPKEVVLVEPSELAIENARLHVGLYGPDKIRTVQKRLDDVTGADIRTSAPVTLHLFANILDVDGIDLKRLANLISDNAEGLNYIVCVSPWYSAASRLFTFKEYFNGIDVFDADSLDQPLDEICMSYAVFRYTPGVSSVVQVKYYPPAQFFAGYQLDSQASMFDQHRSPWKGTRWNPTSWSAFEVYAPFELGGHVYDDVHPVLAVINNVITRGIPTKCSPFIEEAFSAFGENPLPDKLGSIQYDGQESDDVLVRAMQRWTPIGVARIQKTVLEAIICGKLSMSAKAWRVLVRERDVPCAALAFEDLSQTFAHLTALTRDYRDFAMPEVKLTVVANKKYSTFPLHLDADVRTEADDRLKAERFDLVIDVSTQVPISDDRLGFSEFKSNNDCYFVIGPADRIRTTRQIYTSDTIAYLPLGEVNQFGEFQDDPGATEHLTYFLNLLFRKRSFRPGQIPILNRALQNKNVIGLLPTGGGKSLTYQLAALLQPGVTIVIDPLKSLMQDQFEGLVEAGIDACAYINSTISEEEKRAAEKRMESSQLQFVFLTPERLCIYEFRKRLQTMHEMNVYFSYGVIDEVHCVSEWGHDFRFSYLHLGRNMYNYVHTKDQKKRLTLFGLTATASFDVLSDVERELSGSGAYPLDANTIVRYENTDRLELQYKIDRVDIHYQESLYPAFDSPLPKDLYLDIRPDRPANSCKSDYLVAHILEIQQEIEELQSEDSIDRIRRRFAERQNVDVVDASEQLVNDLPDNMFAKRSVYDQSGIVFCPHKDSTGVSVGVNSEALAEIVPDIGTFVGSSDNDRERDEESFRNLDCFKNNEQLLMIATKAFGMGIDKPNVRFTVNMNYPSSLESFVQEAGRAGRDRRIALATILVGDYSLARISPNCPVDDLRINKIKGRWYNEADLRVVLRHFGIEIQQEYIETASPLEDWVKAECADNEDCDDEEKKRRGKMFRKGKCSRSCAGFDECRLKELPSEFRGWRKYKEVEPQYDRLRIPKTNLIYMNTDYGNNMYFYNRNFLGERAEKLKLYELFCQTETEVFLGDTAEKKETQTVSNLLNAVLSLDVGQELVAFVKYTDEKVDGGKSSAAAQKAIYRMCCFGFVDDFTQDYGKHEFRLVMRRKADGDYYEGLKQFLMRYYAEQRAAALMAEVPNYRGENEVQKCLGYLTEFIYSKIAVKRKRALDDVRTFCAMGLSSNMDWKEVNEDLKDFIYYYFNSKYAREEYAIDSGEAFSLTVDTDWGKESPAYVAMKYLRVVEDDLVGEGGTPIDNVKHLQGAVRLIRRSLTDSNPCLALLNYFCLTQLGTNGSETLEQELAEDYSAGMLEFAERFDSKEEFWRFKKDFDDAVESAPHRYDLSQLSGLQDEITAKVHLAALRDIRQAYYGD